VETSYDSYGNLLSLKEHDWGTGAPGAIVRTTTTSFLNTSAYVTANIVNRPTRVTVADGAGTVKARTDIAYDESSYINTSCPTGVAQHNDTSYGCTYTTRGNATTVTAYTDPVTPGGAIAKHSYYDVFGNLVKADLNCCQQKTWTYSATTTYAFPDSATSGSSSPTLTTSATYNSYTGLVLTSTDENGKQTSFDYSDPGHLNRLMTVTRPDGAQVTYSYDDTNRTLQVTSPVQGTSVVKRKTFLDGLGRTIKKQLLDASNTSYSITESQYDSWGRPYKTSNPHNSTAQYWTETRTDALGRTVKAILPDNSQSTTSYSLNAATATDPAGKQRKSVSDGLGRLSKVFEPDVANGNALTVETDYSYTVLDTLSGVTQGAQTRTFLYDALGRLTDSTTPEAGHFQFQYNNYNLPIQRTDARGVITTYGYDSLNRPYTVTYNVGSTGVASPGNITFTYGTDSSQNNNGRLITMTDGVGSENYSYNTLGQLSQLQKIIGTTTYTTQYAYNLAGEPTSLTYPSGRVVQQSFDAIGRLCAVGTSGSTCSTGTTYVTGFSYNTAFQVTSFNYGNGVTAALGFSPDRLQLTSLAYTKGASTLFSLNYSYGAPGSNDGQIAGITDNVDGGRSVAYSYDALYRLANATTTGSASYPKWGLSMTYDRYGNRYQQNISSGCVAPMTCPTSSVTVNPANNRISGSPYAYDANGNMTNDALNTLAYDAESHAVSATNGSTSGTYTYDGKGLRIKKVSGGITTVYVFSGSKVIAEYVNGAAPASPTREYIYSGAALLAKIDSSGTKYYQQDHLSNRLVTDSSGNKVAELGHFAWGESWYNSTNDKLLFTTYERDSESGNDYAMARYHISRLGRFSSPDPISDSTSDPQSLNRYAYVRNGPTNSADPLGLFLVFIPQSPPPIIVFDPTINGTVGPKGDYPHSGNGRSVVTPLAPPRQPPPPPGYQKCIEGALEEVLASGETPDEPDDGYGTLVGGSVASISNPTMIGMGAFMGMRSGHLSMLSLSQLSGNPGLYVQVHAGDTPDKWSSAFGRYQITNTLAKQFKMTDWTPSGQDDAVARMLEYYDAVRPAMEGNFKQAVWNMFKWASMPDSPLSGGKRSMEAAYQTFLDALQYLPECQ
jgi:RHS repeat-associated protein